jgi:deoxycytidine triphosphate deaminase
VAEDCDADVDAAKYWKKPKSAGARNLFVDPIAPAQPGLLAADRIRAYALTVGMIDPFCEDNLKPASYSLTLGPIYQVEGVDGILTVQKPTLTIPPNAMAFVSMREVLRLPHYIAARFNLSIRLVYQGLLLGTGPQVDPGFQGALSCPLYNLSNVPIRLVLGMHLATIDFETTTGMHPATQAAGLHDEDHLYAIAGNLKTDHHIHLFALDKRWVQPVLGYSPGETQTKSSLGDTVIQVGRLREQLRIGAFVATIAVLAVGAAVLGVLAALAIGYWQLGADNLTTRKELEAAQAAQQTSQLDHARLHDCFAAINAALSAPDTKGLTTLPADCRQFQ